MRDLGPIDVIEVKADRGAIAVRLSQREAEGPPIAVAIEILPLAAGDFLAISKRFLASLREDYRADVPTVDGHEGHEIVAMGEVAGFQISVVRGKALLEMAWSGVERFEAVKGQITSGQLEAFAAQVGAVLSAMTPAEKEARLVPLDGWGKAQSIKLEK